MSVTPAARHRRLTWFLATKQATWGSQGEGERRGEEEEGGGGGGGGGDGNLQTFIVQCVHDEGELLEEIHVIIRAA